MQFDDIDKEFLKYIQLNKTKLKYMMIKKFKDGLRDLKTILKERDNQKTRNRTNERNNKIRAERIRNRKN